MNKVLLINKNVVNINNPKTEIQKAACVAYDILSSCFYSDEEIKPYINDKFKNIKDTYFIFNLSRKSVFKYFKKKMKEDIFDFPSGEGTRFLKKKNFVKIYINNPPYDYYDRLAIDAITEYINNHPVEIIKILKIKHEGDTTS